MLSVRAVSALVLGLSLAAACKPEQTGVPAEPQADLSAAPTSDLQSLPPADLASSGPADLTLPAASDLPPECAAAQFVGQREPAAMLVLLDRSQSMAQGGKWTAAQQAIVQAIDQDAFDNMSLGLIATPSGTVSGPACIFNLPVSCQAPSAPQVDLQPTGTDKSGAASGARRLIKDWLTSNTPDRGLGDASPLYAAAQTALDRLRAWPQEGRRILLVVTDGTLSCGQLAGRPGFADCNGCDHDWEDPQNLVSLMGTAKQSANQPVDSFIVGVPGADSYDATGCSYPPYHMRLALSAIAYAGSPENAPAGCTGKAFTKAGADPAASCHFDMTQGTFNAAALATVIAQVRGKLLGCVYELPQPDGGMLDRGQVNVSYTVGGQSTTVVRRRNPVDTCADRACWDYNAAGKIEILGKSCQDIKAGAATQVRIGVGCATILG